MVTIRIIDESTSPPTEWMETLPISSECIMVFRSGKELSILEQIKVNGKSQLVKTVTDAQTIGFVIGGLLGGTESISEG